MVARGARWELPDYVDAVRKNDRTAIDLFHEGGFQNSGDAACYGVQRALTTAAAARPAVVLEALTPEAAAALDCSRALRSALPADLRRDPVGPLAPAEIAISACLGRALSTGRYHLVEACARDGVVAETADRAALADGLEAFRARLAAGLAALDDAARRAALCEACAGGRKAEALFDAAAPRSVLCPALADRAETVRWALAKNTPIAEAPQRYCAAFLERAVGDARAVLESGLAASARLIALGR